jgi:hypothetical protein
MIHDNYFRLMLRAMRRRARYSLERGSWTLPCWDAKIIALEHWTDLRLPCDFFEDFLCEGVQRGLWNVDVDARTGMDVIYMT